MNLNRLDSGGLCACSVGYASDPKIMAMIDCASSDARISRPMPERSTVTAKQKN